MSKERARRRAEREAEIAASAAARERQNARRDRWARWRRSATGWLPARQGPRPGILAAKRRRTMGLVLLGFFVVQLLTWAATPSWGTRFGVLLVSLFAVPLILVLTP